MPYRRLSETTRDRIITLNDLRQGPKAIRGILQKDWGSSFKLPAVSTISQFINKFNKDVIYVDCPRSGRPPKFKVQHYLVIERSMRADDELTAPRLQKMVTDQTGDSFSLQQIQQCKRCLGFVASKPRYCQMIRQQSKVKRLEWSQEMFATSEQFENVIFSDESTIQLDTHARLFFRCSWENARLRPKAKHPVSVHFWAGISTRRLTRIRVLSGIMDSIGYCEILKEELSHFVKSVYLVPLFKAKNLCNLDPNNLLGYLCLKNYLKLCFGTGLNCGGST